MTPPTDPDQWLRAVVVIIITSVSSFIAVAVIAAAIYVPIFSTDETPPALENWGGLIIGFYFGTFVGLLKDWLGKPKPIQAEPSTGPLSPPVNEDQTP